MVQCDALASVCIEIDVHEFSWVDAYLTCGYSPEDDTPIFKVSVWKGVREIFKGTK